MSRKRSLIWLGVLATAIVLSNAVLLLGFDTAHALLSEDGVYEWIGADGLFVAGVLFLMAFRRSAGRPGWTRPSRLFLLGMAAVWLFGAGEEISWGQRIFDFGPTDKAINRQGETNIHNLRVLYDDAPVRPYRLFTLFWFSIVFTVPVIAALYEPARRLFRRFVPIFPWALGGLFVFNDVFAKVPEALIRMGALDLWDLFRVEVRETNLSVLAAVTGFYLYRYMLTPAGEPSAARHGQALTAGRAQGEESPLRRDGVAANDLSSAEPAVTVAAEPASGDRRPAPVQACKP